MDEARDTVAECLNCRSDEVYFTSGGSESDNWAIRMAAHLMADKGKKHIISTAIEHHAVLHTLKALEKQGFEVTLLPVGQNGIVSAKDVRDGYAMIPPGNRNVREQRNRPIQPIAEIGEICREKGVVPHRRGSGGRSYPVDCQMNIDMLAVGA